MTLLEYRRCDADGVEALITTSGDASRTVAVVLSGNPLDDAWRAPAEPQANRMMLASGTLGSLLDEPHPANWLKTGREALDGFCARMLPELTSRGERLLFTPHARHVLSDAPSCVKFLDDHAEEPIGIALAPARLIETTMIAGYG